MFTVTDDMKNEKIYDGVTEKSGITVNSIDYIVKIPKIEDTVYTEYVASNFITNLGIPCHKTYIGYYKNSKVNILKDFTTSDLSLHSFNDIGQSSVETDLGSKAYSYDDVIDIIEKDMKISDTEKVNIIHLFWKMFICDAILANRDRHRGNWGFLKNNITGECFSAPLYDNGNCLFPNVYKVIDEFYNFAKREKFLKQRIYEFPACLLQVYDSDLGRYRKTNYYEMFNDLNINDVLRYECTSLINNGGLPLITNAILSSISDVPKKYSYFYVMIVIMRYLCIIERKPYEKAYSLANNILKGVF